MSNTESELEERMLRIVRKRSVLEAIVSEIAAHPELRCFLLQSLLPSVATKDDIRELREEIHRVRHEIITYIDGRIADLDKRIDALDKRIDALDKRISRIQWLAIVMLSLMMFVIGKLII